MEATTTDLNAIRAARAAAYAALEHQLIVATTSRDPKVKSAALEHRLWRTTRGFHDLKERRRWVAWDHGIQINP